LTCSGTGSFNALTVGATNVGSTLTTLTDLRKTGTFASTTSFATFYTMPNMCRAFITACQSATPNSITCFFEWTLGYPSLTQIAQSGNATQTVLNTTNATSAGTQYIFMQQTLSNQGFIQVKTNTSTTVTWWITFL
jgi:hypothetical protein